MGRTKAVCNTEGPCFAKKEISGSMRCVCLHTTYPAGKKCPFQKPERDVTNGKRYPHRDLVREALMTMKED